MPRAKPDSRAAQARAAERTLLALLRTPKTRPGLIAAVAAKNITRRFVFGWLSEQVRGGRLLVLKSSRQVMYQLGTGSVDETPHEGNYPAWLEPRALPTANSRRTYLDGQRVEETKQKGKK